MRRWWIPSLLVALGLAGGCRAEEPQADSPPPAATGDAATADKEAAPDPEARAELSLVSPAFEAGAPIPERFTCDGGDLSPELAWTEPPEGTRSLALIVDDPDAPLGTWVHWVIWDLDAERQDLPEGVAAKSDLGSDGLNSWKRPGYGGPCPPKGSSHRYFFRLYALDTRLELSGEVKRRALDEAMQGHVLGDATLMGTYQR